MTFEDTGANRRTSLDAAVDVGVNEIEVPDGHQILRLFHTEGTWEERQLRAGEQPVASFTLPAPGYAYTGADAIRMLGNKTAQDAWSLFARTIPDATAPVPSSPFTHPNGAGVHVAVASTLGVTTAFMVPTTRADAVIDVRVYPGDPDDHRRPCIRMRWDHPELGMVLPHLVMNQIGSAAPHVDRLIAEGAFGRMCREGDECGALALAHVQVARRHELGDPRPMLRALASSFPDLPDALLLLAYEQLLEDARDEGIETIRRAIAAGPPRLTASVRVLQTLTIHHQDVPDIAERGRLCARVDPGCLFTSVRLEG